MLQENDPEAREKRLNELANTRSDKGLNREYLLRSSLVQMVEEANSIE